MKQMLNNIVLEYSFTEETKFGVGNLSRHIPILSELICPTLNVAKKIQQEHGAIK